MQKNNKKETEQCTLHGVIKRYETEYAHSLCHPETCCHLWDWYVRDTKTREIVYRCDSLNEAHKERDRLNAL